MSTFINSYLEHTSIYESPSSFWKWSAISAISAVLRDNCYRRQGDSALYPNLYTLFLAPSSGHRKGRPVDTCETLVHKVENTKVISGRASVQGILDELAKTETSKTGKILKGGSAIFYAPELAAGIVDDPAGVKILTDIYDYKTNAYQSYLRTQGKFKIEKMIFSMLAATNIDMSREFLTGTAVKGGMIARTMVIVPDEFRPANSLTEFVDRSDAFKCVIDKLREVSGLAGEFNLEKTAAAEYDKWYLPFRGDYLKKQDTTGILGRIHTSIFKVAMVLAANECSLNIRKHHFEQSITDCMALLPNYTSLFMSVGKSTISEAGQVLLEELLAADGHRMSQKVLLSRNWSKFDLDLLEKVAVTFQAGGLIDRLIEGSTTSYRLTDKCLEMLEGKKGKP